MLVVELADMIGGLVFILGSLCFFPGVDVNLFKFGCECFVLGSTVYALVSLYALAEAVETRGMFALESCENFLYVMGSSVFLLGTLLVWPQGLGQEKFEMMVADSIRMEMHIHVYLNTLNPVFQGSLLCIIGCLCFAFAAFVNGLNIRINNDMSSQLLSAVTSIYMCGSLLFVMGSMAFLPDFGCSAKMVNLGAWMYTIGSCFHFSGSCLSFMRTLSEINCPVWHPALESPMVASLQRDISYSTMKTPEKC